MLDILKRADETLKSCTETMRAQRETIAALTNEVARLQTSQPDCRTCNNLDSCSEDAKWMRNYCTNGDKYEPAPKVVLWRME